MLENQERCEEIIYSNEYADYVIEYSGDLNSLMKIYNPDCVQILNRRFAIIHQKITGNAMVSLNQYGYATVAKCFGLLDTSSVEATGVLRLRRQPYVDLFGQGILIGFIDTGIEYTHRAFINADGTTRILSIWDQTIRDGIPPENIYYGSEYSREEINRALQSENPLSIVPTTDVEGHGTFLAGIAAGNIDEDNDFTGIAPFADIVVVKLKEAKEHLKQYFCIAEEISAYAENDIMMACRYLQNVATKEQKPLAICIGLGSNCGNHSGNLTLSRYLNTLATVPGVAVVVAAGNEGNQGHHYASKLIGKGDYDEVEFRVAEGENGIYMELWGETPNLFSVGFISPIGSFTEKIPVWYTSASPITFPLEKTELFVSYSLVENNTGNEVIVIRLKSPTSGIWRMRVYNEGNQESSYHIWMSMERFVLPETFYLEPTPDITVCESGNAINVLTLTAYDHTTNSLYSNASRGYTIESNIKPELTAPGVNVFGPVLKGRYGRRTGTSVAAAHGVGVAALMLEWGIIKGNQIFMQTTAIENYLVRGARRSENMVYPNREWGYGILDLYETFLNLRG